MVIDCARTRDGRWRVYIHDDHTAELCDDRGRLVSGRLPIYEIARRLAELGVAGDDLVSG
jgi:hypothetical protein